MFSSLRKAAFKTAISARKPLAFRAFSAASPAVDSEALKETAEASKLSFSAFMSSDVTKREFNPKVRNARNQIIRKVRNALESGDSDRYVKVFKEEILENTENGLFGINMVENFVTASIGKLRNEVLVAWINATAGLRVDREEKVELLKKVFSDFQLDATEETFYKTTIRMLVESRDLTTPIYALAMNEVTKRKLTDELMDSCMQRLLAHRALIFYDAIFSRLFGQVNLLNDQAQVSQAVKLLAWLEENYISKKAKYDKAVETNENVEEAEQEKRYANAAFKFAVVHLSVAASLKLPTIPLSIQCVRVASNHNLDVNTVFFVRLIKRLVGAKRFRDAAEIAALAEKVSPLHKSTAHVALEGTRLTDVLLRIGSSARESEQVDAAWCMEKFEEICESFPERGNQLWKIIERGTVNSGPEQLRILLRHSENILKVPLEEQTSLFTEITYRCISSDTREKESPLIKVYLDELQSRKSSEGDQLLLENTGSMASEILHQVNRSHSFEKLPILRKFLQTALPCIKGELTGKDLGCLTFAAAKNYSLCSGSEFERHAAGDLIYFIDLLSSNVYLMDKSAVRSWLVKSVPLAGHLSNRIAKLLRVVRDSPVTEGRDGQASISVADFKPLIEELAKARFSA